MGNLTISTTEILTVIGGAAGLVTAIWHAAMYVGKLTVRVQSHDVELRSHNEQLRDHDDELRFLKGLRGRSEQ
jgi:hypothetical protein